MTGAPHRRPTWPRAYLPCVTEPLKFTTKPKDGAADSDDVVIPPLALELDGVALEAHRPKDALLAELAAINSRRTPTLEKVRLALNFLDDCLVEPGRSHVRSRLTDEDDEFDAEDCIPMLTAIADHWKAHAPARSRRDRRRR